MSNMKIHWLVAGLREFSAEMLGQFVLYATLLSALAAWFSFRTVYAPIIVGVGGVFLSWVVYAYVLGDKKGRRTGRHS